MDESTSIRLNRSTVHELTMIRASLQRALHRPVTSHDEAINILMEQWKLSEKTLGSEDVLEQYQERLEEAMA